VRLVETDHPEVKLVEPTVHRDHRGWLMEVWHRDRLAGLGLEMACVQDNHSRSARGTLRGLHYQNPRPQGKLVRCSRGEVFSAAVDLRRSSRRFRGWAGARLSEENRQQLWIPPGFAHGFLALTEGAEVQYKCTETYHPRFDRAVAWDDPEIAVRWPVEEVGELLLSDRDRAAPKLRDAEVYP
jgi:dTDP-4-dehydrorhamnose 3,5-epimerase